MQLTLKDMIELTRPLLLEVYPSDGDHSFSEKERLLLELEAASSLEEFEKAQFRVHEWIKKNKTNS